MRRRNRPRPDGHGVDFEASIDELISGPDPDPFIPAPPESEQNIFANIPAESSDQGMPIEPELGSSPRTVALPEVDLDEIEGTPTPQMIGGHQDDFDAALDKIVDAPNPLGIVPTEKGPSESFPPNIATPEDPFANMIPADEPVSAHPEAAVFSDVEVSDDFVLTDGPPAFDSKPAANGPSAAEDIFGLRTEPEEILTPYDSEMPESLAPGEAPQEPEGQIYVAAREGLMAGPTALSVISNIDPDEDELNMALSAFAELSPGQAGFIRYSVRSYPAFKSQSQAWLNARRGVGPDPEHSNQSLPKKLMAWVSYGTRLLWFEVNKDSPSQFGGRRRPLRPGGTRGDVKPLTSSQVSDEEKQAWRDSEMKARDTVHYEVALRVGAIGKPEDKQELERIVEEAGAGYAAYATPHQHLVFGPADPMDALTGYMGTKQQSVELALSAAELGELARVPDDLTRPHGVGVVKSMFKQLPLRKAIFIDDMYNPPKGLIPIGLSNPGSEDQRVIAIPNATLDQHAYWAGATGSGKTELMKWFAFGVAKADYPFVVIDPHGALSEELINALIINCPERVQDLVLCDLSDDDYPVALNPLDISSPNSLEPTVNSVMEMLAKQMNLGATAAPRASNIARQAIMALTEANLAIRDPETKCTLLHVVPFFLDQEFRQEVIQFSKTVSVIESFNPDTGFFELLNDKQRAEFVSPILRAFQPLSTSQSFSSVFSAGENRLNFHKLISGRKIVIVKLARFSHQAALGEFVGSLILPWLLSSMDDWGRKKDPLTGEYVGNGCRVFVDEAPTLLGPESSAIQLLAEARKWDLGLLFVSQYLTGQLDPTVIKATLANTMSKISFKLEPDSARLLAQAISGTSGIVSGGDVADLPPYYYYANVMIQQNGRRDTTGPFSAAALPPINDRLTAEHEKVREMVVDRSRKWVCNDRDFINRKKVNGLADLKNVLAQMISERVQKGTDQRGPISVLDPDEDTDSFKDADFTIK